MTIRPIIFSAPMVLALMEGRKTQTRRILPPLWQEKLAGHDKVKTWFAPPAIPKEGVKNEWAQSGIWAEKHGPLGYNKHLGFSPYRPGDLLYVREAHYVWCAGNADGTGRRVDYRATTPDAPCTWSPSIHMPRWASRLTLAVTDVRVQRLQKISEADAIAEGVATTDFWAVGVANMDSRCQPGEIAFRCLWNSLHGMGAWDQNPWVVAVTFTVHKVNVDELVRQGGLGIAA